MGFFDLGAATWTAGEIVTAASLNGLNYDYHNYGGWTSASDAAPPGYVDVPAYLASLLAVQAEIEREQAEVVAETPRLPRRRAIARDGQIPS